MQFDNAVACVANLTCYEELPVNLWIAVGYKSQFQSVLLFGTLSMELLEGGICSDREGDVPKMTHEWLTYNCWYFLTYKVISN